MPDEDKGQGAVKAGEQEEQSTPESATGEIAEKDVAKPEEKTVDIEALQQEIEKQKELAKYHLDQWKRTAADLENYRKRTEKERGELVKFGHAVLITKLLPVLDDFDRAFQTLPAAFNSLTWTEGLALIDRKLRLALEQQGLKEIEALGKSFDPALHEALFQEQNNAYPDGQVTAVLQKGYMLHDRVLRPAIVKVARNEQSSTATGPTDTETAERHTVTSEQKGESEVK